MFVSRNNNANTKKYQKPNILRKKPKKPVKKCLPETLQTANIKAVVSATVCGTRDLQEANLTYSNTFIKPIEKSNLEDVSWCGDVPNTGNNSFLSNRRSLLIDCEEENGSLSSVNVELFLNDSETTQNITQFEIDSDSACNIKHDWSLDFEHSSQEIIIQNINEFYTGNNQNAGESSTTDFVVPPSSATEQTTPATSPSVPLTIEYLASGIMNFKCDVGDCNKRFRSEQNLNKHKQTHNAGTTEKTAKQTMAECPVKKVRENGEQDPCGRKFATRDELAKHLNEDHTLEEANFNCAECGRRFFWAMGVRAHARALCGRRALACGWPGCGREFRQPCRLREHARKHTGDKPYPCRYPNCGWSFRTASKLVRHARRHTDERRHACAACGRAFLRREHLRDHLARHKADHHHVCAHPGCHRTFTHLETLFKHIRKVHKEEPGNIPEASTLPSTKVEETYTVSLSSPMVTPSAELKSDIEITDMALDPDVINSDLAINSDAVVSDLPVGMEEWHSARTHCTWPLTAKGEPERVFDEPANQYVLDEDVQVEMSENSESNIYTIRSDLFLHGNILNNEDSEQMAVGVIQPGRATSPAIDGGLGLLDSHAIDLMQEELLYTDDTAVDESSFRVFLLSGEEIQII